MSTFEAKPQRWRRVGSLRYLAIELNLSDKQVARYWDKGWIPNWYRSPKGQRRVRYNDDTVQQLSRMVKAAKETNIHIRYHTTEINYKGTPVPTKGCNSMDDLYHRAKKIGLSEQDARDLAYRLRIVDREPSSDDIAWQTLLALQGTSEEEVACSIRELDCIPLLTLMGAKGAEDFRARAARAWKDIEAALEGREKKSTIAIVRDLLNQPDLRAFVERWNEVTELENRITETDGRTFYATHEKAAQDSDQLRLQVAALRLKHQQVPPSALALAGALNLSRPALYRAFGAKAIQDALKTVRDDAYAAGESRNDQWTRGKSRRTNAQK